MLVTVYTVLVHRGIWRRTVTAVSTVCALVVHRGIQRRTWTVVGTVNIELYTGIYGESRECSLIGHLVTYSNWTTSFFVRRLSSVDNLTF